MIESLDPQELTYDFQHRDSNNVIMADLWARAVTQRFGKDFQVGISVTKYLFTASGKAYMPKAEREAIIRRIHEKYDAAYDKYIHDETLRTEVFFRDSAKAILDELETTPLDQLWQRCDAIMVKSIPWFFLPWIIIEENIVTDAVRGGLEPYREEIERITDLPNAVMLLSYPVKEVMLLAEHEALYQLARLMQKTGIDEQFKAEAEKYLQRFAWMTTYCLCPGEVLSYEGLVEKVKQQLASGFVEEYELQLKRKEEDRKMVQQILTLIGTDKQCLDAVQRAREAGWVLNHSAESFYESFALLIPFYKRVAQACGLTYQEWVYLTNQEIQLALKGKPVDKKMIKQRREAFVFLLDQGKQQIIAGKEAVVISERLDREIGAVSDHSQVSGTCACPGKVTGRIRLASSIKDAKRVKEGEVLVCSMTTPDHVPAMKRAAAIVTDEGGLLCHAAIVARELHKPCVIGTKDATRVFKDGDMVEVDAEKGTIKKVKA